MEVMGWIFVALLLCLVLAILTYLKQMTDLGTNGYFIIFIFINTKNLTLCQERRGGGPRRLRPEAPEVGGRAAAE